MDRERTLQIRTGVFTLVVLAALAAVVASLNREGGLLRPSYTLYADFDNIEGLFVNSPVWLAGKDVGRVRNIEFREPGAERAIRVELDLDARVRDRIRTDSMASVRMAGVIGDMYVSVTLGTDAGEPLQDHGSVPTSEPLRFNQLADKGAELLDNMVAFSASADRIVGSFEDAMGTESVASTLGSLQRIIHEVETGDGLMHSMIYTPSETAGEDLGLALRELRTSLGRFNTLLAEVESGDGLLHEFIYGGDDLDQMSTLAAIRGAAERMESILTSVDQGEGSLGAFINDPTLYEDIKLLVSGARESALLRTMIDFVRPEDGYE